ncbi:MOSC domain-containing protein [Pseudooceanicola onchidii]|uniref:MOSC domain-containing protein n=1 Tax=Pseudooceanicola onchidii TaxID=2562279 RepID=UPI0010AB4052|nr:MOSC N-terminal beta barrel domain-containing protein [Pseudooceanicola onchidii]
MATVAAMYRHPIKAIGREEVDEVDLIAGQTLPGDRLWAVAHEAAKLAEGEWNRCVNFIRGASSPKLMAVSLKTEGKKLRLSHPDLADLLIDPATEGPALINWVRPLVDKGRAAPTHVFPAPIARGLTDTADPTISLAGMASHEAVAARAAGPFAVHRWRCNIFLDGLTAWEEFDWVGRTIRLGEAKARVEKRIDRCMATTVNTETGDRDVPTLDILKDYGHQDFSVGVIVTKGGRLRTGDKVEVL